MHCCPRGEKNPVADQPKLNSADYGWIILRMLIGCIFVYAGFIKLVEPVQNFQAAISDLNLIPTHLVPWIARIVPWIELIGGTFLLLGYLPRWSSVTISSLSLVFVFLLGASVLAGKGMKPCGCFGESGIKLTTNQMFVLDLLVCMTCLRLYLRNSFPFSFETWLNRR